MKLTDIFKRNLIRNLLLLVPGIVIYNLIGVIFKKDPATAAILDRVVIIYIIIIMILVCNSILMAVSDAYGKSGKNRNIPLKGLFQALQVVVYFIGGIIIIAVLLNKSPSVLLTGLGASAAVLMLVFKDSILGVVAGVQLAENDSLHVGDWIAVPGTNANGTVQEVSLTAVKVLNWDKTTTTLPPYSLISGGFTNYRTMQRSNTRLICRSYMIDADSLLPATPEMLEAVRKLPFMDAWVGKKLEQRAAGRDADVDNPEGLVDGTIDTNLGLFRAYFKMWLDASPLISHESDCFVSTLPQTPTGIPFQVYCFTATSKWFPYEASQDTVFEHLAAMLSKFQLYTFENPSGRDTIVDGYLSPGGKIDDVFGVPYPFFQSPDAPDSPASTSVAPRQPEPAK